MNFKEEHAVVRDGGREICARFLKLATAGKLLGPKCRIKWTWRSRTITLQNTGFSSFSTLVLVFPLNFHLYFSEEKKMKPIL